MMLNLILHKLNRNKFDIFLDKKMYLYGVLIYYYKKFIKNFVYDNN